MGYALAAAAVIGAAGAGMSASGASKNAKAIAAAQKDIQRDETRLYNRWSGQLDTLISDKETKLYDLGNIFDRFQSTGVFGENTETLDNLRQAQLDFSRLAAGDFTGFESQIRKTLSDYTIATVGSGSPIGTFAGLAADAQLNYRLQGIQTAQGIGSYLSQEANNLLGLEFGVMDQGFQVGYELDRSRQNAVNSAMLGQAQTVGVSQQAWGGALSTTASLIGSYGTYMNNSNVQQQSLQMQRQQLDNMSANANAARSTVSPIAFNNTPSYTPTYTGGYPDGISTTALPIGNLPSWSSGAPTPVNEAVYNTMPMLPGDDIGVLPPLSQNQTNPYSAAVSNYASNMASPFSSLYNLGRQIATGSR